MKYVAVLLVLAPFLFYACNSSMLSNQQDNRATNSKPVRPEVVMLYDYYTSNDSVHFFFRFEDVRQVLDLQRTIILMDYTVRTGASEDDLALISDSLQASEQTADLDAVNFVVTLPAAFVSSPRILHLRVWQKFAGQERLGIAHKVVLRHEMLQKNYFFTKDDSELPLFRGYVNQSERLVLHHFGEAEQFKLQFYNTAFTPALPPMSGGQEQVPRTIKIAETFTYETGDTIAFEEPGLYLVEANAGAATGVLVQPGNFPFITNANELIQPLLYITTANERKALYNAKDPKAAVDEFWLRVAGDKTIARELIRIFYSRVEAANKLFSSHKAGWSTDRGMIYIIYGQPDKISQSGTAITWVYQGSASATYVKFVFNKKQNNFTENHYELERRREYEESWYSTVAKWRAGVTDI